MDFNSKVETISSSQLDALFGETSPNGTPGADSLIVGSQQDDNNFLLGNNTNPNIPTIDLDNLDSVPNDTKDISKQEPPKQTETPDDKVEPQEGSEGDDNQEGQNKGEENQENSEQVNLVLKNTASYLISKGLWNDIDKFEELDITPELYAEIAAKQEESKIDEMFGELVDSTGPYGKAIISHIKNGGDPDEIIDIFKEQKQVENIDTSDPQGQEDIISKYYSEVVGWNKTKIDKYINNLKSEEDGLETEAKDLQSKFDKLYEDKVKAVETAEQEKNREKAKKQQDYINTLSTTIDTFEGFTDKEKKLVKDSVLKFNKKLDNGTPINEFYLKFNQIQRDPKEYVELIHFIMDKKGYQEKFKQVSETKATDKTWNFVKNNGSIRKNNSEIVPKETSKTPKIDFSGLIKK